MTTAKKKPGKFGSRCVHVLFEMDTGAKVELRGEKAHAFLCEAQRLYNNLPSVVKSSLAGARKMLSDANPTLPVEPERHTVVRQDWEESEAGWGCRPDGYSLHLTMEDRDAYVTKFCNDERRRNPSGKVPHEYTRTCGNPHPVTVGAEKFTELNTPEAKKHHGVKFWRGE